MDFNESITKENIARAFAGECQDGARYQFISQQCMKDGYNYIGNTLKTLAKNEMAHAKALYEIMLKYTKGTNNVAIEAGYPFDIIELPNSILEASEVEIMEAQNIYPSFARTARDEGFEDVGELFDLIADVENCHYLLLKEVGEKLKKNTLYREKDTKWKCSNCGHEETSDTAWQQCPLCTMEQGFVIFPIADN